MANNIFELATLCFCTPNKHVVLVFGSHIIEPSKYVELVSRGGNLRHWVKRALRLGHPYTLQLSIGRHVHFHGVGLHIVKSYEGAVFAVYRKIDGSDVSDGIATSHLSIDEIGIHIF